METLVVFSVDGVATTIPPGKKHFPRVNIQTIPCQDGALRRGGGKDAPGLAEVRAAPGHPVEPALCERG